MDQELQDKLNNYLAFGVYHCSQGKYPKVRRLLCLLETVHNVIQL